MFCKGQGQGHLHITKCDAIKREECTHSKTDGRRHEQHKYEPHPEIPKDEMTHEHFWNSINFEDPCSKEEQDIFKKCAHFCANDHEETTDEKKQEKYYCQLPLWHDKADRNKPSPTGSGHVSADGHVFDCSHKGSGRYHIVLALDDSGSMMGQPWRDLETAVVSFLQKRLAVSSHDLVSIVIHNHVARIACEQRHITSNPEQFMRFGGGNNDFAAAFQVSNEVLSRTDFTKYTPMLLFLSDGGCGNGEIEATEIGRRYLSKGLVYYTIAFGSRAFQTKLQNLATLGGGQFVYSPDGIALSNAFVEVASKLSSVALAQKFN